MNSTKWRVFSVSLLLFLVFSTGYNKNVWDFATWYDRLGRVSPGVAGQFSRLEFSPDFKTSNSKSILTNHPQRANSMKSIIYVELFQWWNRVGKEKSLSCQNTSCGILRCSKIQSSEQPDLGFHWGWCSLLWELLGESQSINDFSCRCSMSILVSGYALSQNTWGQAEI